jgi:hypothetical protein
MRGPKTAETPVGGRWRLLCVLVGVCALRAGPVRGDAAPPTFSMMSDGLNLKMFTDPSPPRVGSVDLNVIVESPPANARPALPDIQIVYYPVDAPRQARTLPIVRAPGINKSFCAAEMELNKPGLWEVEVRLEGQFNLGQVARFTIEVEERRAAGDSFVVWVVLPAVAVGVFIAHRRLVARRQRTTAPRFGA